MFRKVWVSSLGGCGGVDEGQCIQTNFSSLQRRSGGVVPTSVEATFDPRHLVPPYVTSHKA
jgi:hypothetical protein